jgi:hypothetical protein
MIRHPGPEAPMFPTFVAVLVLGPMVFLLWRQIRRVFRAMIALRDRIDGVERH